MGEIRSALQSFADNAPNVEAVKQKLERWDRTIQFSLEGEDPFHMQFRDGSVTFHDGVAERPNVTFRAKAEVFRKIMSGELDRMKAFMTRQLLVEGSLSDAMRFSEISDLIRRSTS